MIEVFIVVSSATKQELEEKNSKYTIIIASRRISKNRFYCVIQNA